jgi:hypothetical protein
VKRPEAVARQHPESLPAPTLSRIAAPPLLRSSIRQSETGGAEAERQPPAQQQEQPPATAAQDSGQTPEKSPAESRSAAPARSTGPPVTGTVLRWNGNWDQGRAWCPTLIGALTGSALWVLGTLDFRIYVANFANYDRTYGFVAGIIVLLLWLYMSATAILFGGEVAATLEQKAGLDPPR